VYNKAGGVKSHFLIPSAYYLDVPPL
jgi:hypothetical protein